MKARKRWAWGQGCGAVHWYKKSVLGKAWEGLRRKEVNPMRDKADGSLLYFQELIYLLRFHGNVKFPKNRIQTLLLKKH
jgi:hypothetical protein